jgi:hypothetical protein
MGRRRGSNLLGDTDSVWNRTWTIGLSEDARFRLDRGRSSPRVSESRRRSRRRRGFGTGADLRGDPVVARDDEGNDGDELVEKKTMETTAGSGAPWNSRERRPELGVAR